MGCGNGISTLAISKEGKYTHTYGVDISPEAIKRCKGLSFKSDAITFIHGDALGEEESITSLYGKCDAVFDSQFFHAGIMSYCIIITWYDKTIILIFTITPIYTMITPYIYMNTVHSPERADYIASKIVSFLSENGRLLVLAGNNSSASLSRDTTLRNGPTMLSREDLLDPFLRAGLSLISIEETRFDQTRAYGDMPPLAWMVILERRR